MRTQILTDTERERLIKWIKHGEETQTTRNLFSKIRKNLPQLKTDVILLIRIRKHLLSKKRWNSKPRLTTQVNNSLITNKKIQLEITNICPHNKRLKYINLLENLSNKLDTTLNDPITPMKFKLRAMTTLNKIIKTCYGMVKDIEIEMLEEEFNRLDEDKVSYKERLYDIEEK